MHHIPSIWIQIIRVLIVGAVFTLFLNKNGLQPLAILASLLALPIVIIKRHLFTRDQLLAALVICVFFFSVVLTETLHSGPSFSSTVLDAPSRHPLAAITFLFIVMYGVNERIFWYSWWIASATSFIQSMFHLNYLPTSLFGYTPTWLLGSQAWTTGVQAFATMALVSAGVTLFTPASFADTWIKKIILLTCAGLGLVAALSSGTRAPFLALAALIPLLALHHRQWLKLILYSVVVGGLVVIVSLYLDSHRLILSKFKAIDNEVHCFLTTDEPCGSVGMRLAMYEGGVRAFLDKPFIGHGMNSAETMEKLVEKGFMRDIPVLTNFHNDFIQIAATQGLIGLIPFMGMLIYMSHRISNRSIKTEKERSSTNACLWILASILICSQTQLNFDRTSTTSFFIFSLAFLGGISFHHQYVGQHPTG